MVLHWLTHCISSCHQQILVAVLYLNIYTGMYCLYLESQYNHQHNSKCEYEVVHICLIDASIWEEKRLDYNH